ncbi:hypothetical protein XENTR_v10001205 [Xenopus tropicalis]|nr:hypothetical protein XENTR_v10001205 [Xenopus tropicalis]
MSACCNSYIWILKVSEHRQHARGTGGGPPMKLHLLAFEEDMMQVIGDITISGIEDPHYDTDVTESQHQQEQQQQSEAAAFLAVTFESELSPVLFEDFSFNFRDGTVG